MNTLMDYDGVSRVRIIYPSTLDVVGNCDNVDPLIGLRIDQGDTIIALSPLLARKVGQSLIRHARAATKESDV